MMTKEHERCSTWRKSKYLHEYIDLSIRGVKAGLQPEDKNRYEEFVLVREALESADPHRLARLAESPFGTVRMAVARREETPTATLLELAHDYDPGVRDEVATNPASTLEVLLRLPRSQQPVERIADLYRRAHPDLDENLPRKWVLQLARTWGNKTGAIDLMSVMVAIIVMAIISAVILGSIFFLIPWGQDNGAKSQLDSIKNAESAYLGKETRYGSLYKEGSELATAQIMEANPERYCAVIKNHGATYTAYSLSDTGRLFTETDGGAVSEYTGSGDLTTLCTPTCVITANGGGTIISIDKCTVNADDSVTLHLWGNAYGNLYLARPNGLDLPTSIANSSHVQFNWVLPASDALTDGEYWVHLQGSSTKIATFELYGM